MIATVVLAATLDACHILTKADIASVQGEAYTAAKLTTRDARDQCFYELPTFSKSVSIDLTRKGGRDFWEKTFEGEHESEADEKATPPAKVGGVGSEAFWVGSRVSGSLYVRKGDKVLRVSVGGPGDDKEKLAKSKKLALLALKRL